MLARDENDGDGRPGQWVVPLHRGEDLPSVRRWVRARLASWATAERRDDVLLVVDELMANAFVHGGPPRFLRFVRHDGSVLVEVADGVAASPTVQPWSATRPSGRGMALVKALSTTWGTRRQRVGKVVWSMLHASPVPLGEQA